MVLCFGSEFCGHNMKISMFFNIVDVEPHGAVLASYRCLHLQISIKLLWATNVKLLI